MKNNKIQIVRGIAIIVVVCIHCLPLGIAQVYVRPFLNFGVALFLFLSGYLTKKGHFNITNRIKKVLIPYFIWSIIYTLEADFTNLNNVPIDIIKNLITTYPAPMMYFIFVYCELTLLLPLISKLAYSKYKYLGFTITPLEIVLVRVLPLIFDIQLNRYFILLMRISFVPWFIFYYLGYLIGNRIISLNIKSSNLLIILVITLAIQVAESYLYYCLGDSNPGTQLKLSTIISNIIIILLANNFISSKSKVKLKWFVIYGDYSFGIFFIHCLIISFLSKIPYYDSFMIFPLNAFIVLIISLLVVFAGNKLLGKWSKYIGFYS